ncbi:Scr1 family TA system antitoxin-like transcriptional regulator [Streptomyces sp. NPDC090741]|uniref:helix-turn-helix domain-containing protein n=1 Tax=Streptomyces sp. NPDC090741 TaxID=3365967 RepID=UPI00380C957E
MTDPVNPSEPMSSALRRGLGAQIRTLREKHGVSRTELGGQTNFSGSAIGAFERGDRTIDPGMVVRLDELLSADGLLKAVVPYLEEEERYSPQFRNFRRIEAMAVSLWVYCTHRIHGLLQTEAYARTLFENHIPAVSDAEIERRLAGRMDRHKLFYRDPRPTLCFVLDAPFLLRKIGGEEVWREQLQHLLELSKPPNVRIQILPMECEEPVGELGPMTIAETPDRRMFGYVESQGHSAVISQKDVVSEMIQRHANIRGVALSPKDSARWIKQLLGEQ